ncbi:MAG: hypothetical protein IJU89_02415 [Alphaproteobacteria bacterium]|nr:hypothetical protein [Alphaproteobacteria bacterium]
MKTLHLVLKSKWYDLIDCGAKTSEYRECKPYWNNRFSYLCRDGAHGADDYARYNNYDGWDFTPYCEYTRVCFHRGYTGQTMVFEINKVLITTQPNDLGLDKCWEIKLGQRIN